jgi:hypothetical protein
MSTSANSSHTVSVKLSANGKNWKDWSKQLTNYAAGEGGGTILESEVCPTFNAASS